MLLCSLSGLWAADTTIANLTSTTTIADPWRMPWENGGVLDYSITFNALTNLILNGMANQSFATTAAHDATNGFPWLALAASLADIQHATNDLNTALVAKIGNATNDLNTGLSSRITGATNTLGNNLLATITAATNDLNTTLGALPTAATNTLAIHLLATITASTNDLNTALLTKIQAATNDLNADLQPQITTVTNGLLGDAPSDNQVRRPRQCRLEGTCRSVRT